MSRKTFTALILLGITAIPSLLAQDRPELRNARVQMILPTANDALFRDDPGAFFQPTSSGRLFSGAFGFTRSTEPDPPKYFNQFHEGVDIKPLKLDANGIALDDVWAALDGEVVYVNQRANKSSFGIYVVIRHAFAEGDAFTLYGHLASASVKAGQKIRAGERLGRVGYTGNAQRDRPHLHFEFAFLNNRHWAQWFERYGKRNAQDLNEHGIWNGNNLQGVDPVPIWKANHAGKPMTLGDILKREEHVFTVRVPAAKHYFDWQLRFPQMVEGGINSPTPTSWDVACNRIGMPLYFKRSNRPVPVGGQLVWFDLSRSWQDSFCRGLVHRTGPKEVVLTDSGKGWFHGFFYLPQEDRAPRATPITTKR
jgi:murein DD-endopeptidase MepM/ murein hydrolase activator NlpD